MKRGKSRLPSPPTKRLSSRPLNACVNETFSVSEPTSTQPNLCNEAEITPQVVSSSGNKPLSKVIKATSRLSFFKSKPKQVIESNTNSSNDSCVAKKSESIKNKKANSNERPSSSSQLSELIRPLRFGETFKICKSSKERFLPKIPDDKTKSDCIVQHPTKLERPHSDGKTFTAAGQDMSKKSKFGMTFCKSKLQQPSRINKNITGRESLSHQDMNISGSTDCVAWKLERNRTFDKEKNSENAELPVSHSDIPQSLSREQSALFRAFSEDCYEKNYLERFTFDSPSISSRASSFGILNESYLLEQTFNDCTSLAGEIDDGGLISEENQNGRVDNEREDVRSTDVLKRNNQEDHNIKHLAGSDKNDSSIGTTLRSGKILGGCHNQKMASCSNVASANNRTENSAFQSVKTSRASSSDLVFGAVKDEPKDLHLHGGKKEPQSEVEGLQEVLLKARKNTSERPLSVFSTCSTDGGIIADDLGENSEPTLHGKVADVRPISIVSTSSVDTGYQPDSDVECCRLPSTTTATPTTLTTTTSFNNNTDDDASNLNNSSSAASNTTNSFSDTLTSLTLPEATDRNNNDDDADASDPQLLPPQLPPPPPQPPVVVAVVAATPQKSTKQSLITSDDDDDDDDDDDYLILSDRSSINGRMCQNNGGGGGDNDRTFSHDNDTEVPLLTSTPVKQTDGGARHHAREENILHEEETEEGKENKETVCKEDAASPTPWPSSSPKNLSCIDEAEEELFVLSESSNSIVVCDGVLVRAPPPAAATAGAVVVLRSVCGTVDETSGKAGSYVDEMVDAGEIGADFVGETIDSGKRDVNFVDEAVESGERGCNVVEKEIDCVKQGVNIVDETVGAGERDIKNVAEVVDSDKQVGNNIELISPGKDQMLHSDIDTKSATLLLSTSNAETTPAVSSLLTPVIEEVDIGCIFKTTETSSSSDEYPRLETELQTQQQQHIHQQIPSSHSDSLLSEPAPRNLELVGQPCEEITVPSRPEFVLTAVENDGGQVKVEIDSKDDDDDDALPQSQQVKVSEVGVSEIRIQSIPLEIRNKTSSDSKLEREPSDLETRVCQSSPTKAKVASLDSLLSRGEDERVGESQPKAMECAEHVVSSTCIRNPDVVGIVQAKTPTAEDKDISPSSSKTSPASTKNNADVVKKSQTGRNPIDLKKSSTAVTSSSQRNSGSDANGTPLMKTPAVPRSQRVNGFPLSSSTPKTTSRTPQLSNSVFSSRSKPTETPSRKAPAVVNRSTVSKLSTNPSSARPVDASLTQLAASRTNTNAVEKRESNSPKVKDMSLSPAGSDSKIGKRDAVKNTFPILTDGRPKAAVDSNNLSKKPLMTKRYSVFQDTTPMKPPTGAGVVRRASVALPTGSATKEKLRLKIEAAGTPLSSTSNSVIRSTKKPAVLPKPPVSMTTRGTLKSTQSSAKSSPNNSINKSITNVNLAGSTDCKNSKKLEEMLTQRDIHIKRLKVDLTKSMSAFEALTFVVKHVDSMLEKKHSCLMSTSKKLHQASSAMAAIKEQLACITHQRDSLTSELQSLEDKHRKDVEKLKESFNAEKKVIEKEAAKKMKSELEKANKHHTEAQTGMKASFNKQMEQLKQDHLSEIAEMVSQHNGEVSMLNEQHDRKLRSVTGDHKHQLDELTFRFEQMKMTLLDKVEVLRSECDDLRRRESTFMESCQREAETHVQSCLSRYKHLPQEIESLKAVLELRNQEAHELRSRNNEMQKEAEELAESRKTIRALKQKIENLEAIVDMRSDYERQLSEKHQLLLRKYDRESKANKRLSMDKEELMWKLTRSDMSSQFSATHPLCSLQNQLPSSMSSSFTSGVTAADRRTSKSLSSNNDKRPISVSDAGFVKRLSPPESPTEATSPTTHQHPDVFSEHEPTAPSFFPFNPPVQKVYNTRSTTRASRGVASARNLPTIVTSTTTTTTTTAGGSCSTTRSAGTTPTSANPSTGVTSSTDGDKAGESSVCASGDGGSKLQRSGTYSLKDLDRGDVNM